MKTALYLPFILLLCLVYTGCGKNSSQNELYNHDEHVKKELKSGKYFSNLYLDLSFGMTSDQADFRISQLIEDNVLKPKLALSFTNKFAGRKYIFNGYPHEFKISNYKADALIIPEFEADSLTGLSILLYQFSVKKDTYLTMHDLQKIFDKKYGAGKSKDLSNTTSTTYWINGNRQVSLENSYFGFIITYENLLATYRKSYIDSLAKEMKKANL